MSRPKMPTKDKIIRWLTENPNKQITYLELAKRFDSHAIAVGQIMKSLGKDPKYKELTKQVVHSNPGRKRGRSTQQTSMAEGS